MVGITPINIPVEVTTELEGDYVPEVTISHDRLASGEWRYKTSLTMLMGSSEAVVKALEEADAIGRAEARRRMDADAAAKQAGTASL